MAFGSDEPLGLEVQRTHDLPIVRRLVRPNGGVGAGERGGCSVGSFIVAVSHVNTIGLDYLDVIKRVKVANRPLDITFRRLHATRDPPPHLGRLWQGFLRIFVGHWTGRFYLLRANGELQAFAGSDDSIPVETFQVVGSTLFSGAAARDAAASHDLFVPDSDGQGLFSNIDELFALELPPQLAGGTERPFVFFRAGDPERRSEWIAALASLEIAHAPSSSLGSPGEIRDKQENSSDPMSMWPPFHVLKQGFVDKRLSIEKVGPPASKASEVMSGLIAASASNSSKWKRIWLMLVPAAKKEPELGSASILWFHRAPSDQTELPLGSFSLSDAKLEGTRWSNIEETSFVIHEGSRSLALRFEADFECQQWRSAILSAIRDGSSTSPPSDLATEKSQEFATMQTGLLRFGQSPRLTLTSWDVSFSMMIGGAARLTQAHDDVGSGEVLRADFCAVAGQYFLPAADAFAASAIFDALTAVANVPQPQPSQSKPSTGVSTARGASSGMAERISDLFGDIAARAAAEKKKFTATSGGDRFTRTISAAPLAVGVSLPRDIFASYCRNLEAVTRANESWEVLRCRVGLDVSQILVRVDDRVTARSSKATDMSPQGSLDTPVADSPGSPKSSSSPAVAPTGDGASSRLSRVDVGTVFLTDSHLVFSRKGRLTTIRGFETTATGSRPVVRIVPLSSIRAVRDLGEDGLLLEDARILTSRLDDKTAMFESSRGIVLGFSGSARLSAMFSSGPDSTHAEEVKAVGGGRTRASRQRNLLRESIIELVAAHRIAAENEVSGAKGGIRPLDLGRAPQAARRRGGGAIAASLQTAWSLGFRELWRRKGSAELSEDELWEIEVSNRSLVMWAAANLLRKRALMRCSGRPASGMLFCTRYLERPQPQNAVHWFILDTFSKGPEQAQAQHQMQMRNWLNILSMWLCHRDDREEREAKALDDARYIKATPSFENLDSREETKRLTTAYSEAFQPSKFKDEWQLFMSFVDPFVDNFIDVLPGTPAHALVYWYDPLLSLGVLTCLLAIAWHDLVHMVPTFVLLGYAASILFVGSVKLAGEQLRFLSDSKALASTAPLSSRIDRAAATLQNVTIEEEVGHDGSQASMHVGGKDNGGGLEVCSSEICGNAGVDEDDDCTEANFASAEKRLPGNFEPSDFGWDEWDDEQVVAVAAAAAARRLSSAQKPGMVSSVRSKLAPLRSESLPRKDTAEEEKSPRQRRESECLEETDPINIKPEEQLSSVALSQSALGDKLDDDQIVAMAAAAAARRMNTSTSLPAWMKQADKVFSSVVPSKDWSKQATEQVMTSVRSNITPSKDSSASGPSPVRTATVESLDEDFARRTPIHLEHAEESDGEEDTGIKLKPGCHDSEDGFSRADESRSFTFQRHDGTIDLSQSEHASTDTPAPSAPSPEDSPNDESFLVFMFQMRAHLGRLQLHLHRQNLYLLRLRSLQHWRDRTSTDLLLLALICGAVWLATVPLRVTFALGTIYVFARPIRKPLRPTGARRALSDAVIDQWLDGIPLDDAPTHRSVAVAVQAALLSESEERAK